MTKPEARNRPGSKCTGAGELGARRGSSDQPQQAELLSFGAIADAYSGSTPLRLVETTQPRSAGARRRTPFGSCLSALFRTSDFGLRISVVIRRSVFVIFLVALLPCLAQTSTGLAPATNPPPPAVESTNASPWSFSASVTGYLVPDSRDYAQPTFAADRGWLHLEARYNYDSLNSGSAWLGYNLGGGRKVEWEFTPMLGGVFGDLNGIAPGYKGTVSWWKLELYTEGEYVFDTGDATESFFYSWSELSLSPMDWFRFGAVVQRTKLYQTEFDIQRGLLVGFACKRVSFTTYIFNPDATRPTVVLGVGVRF